MDESNYILMVLLSQVFVIFSGILCLFIRGLTAKMMTSIEGEMCNGMQQRSAAEFELGTLQFMLTVVP